MIQNIITDCKYYYKYVTMLKIWNFMKISMMPSAVDSGGAGD